MKNNIVEDKKEFIALLNEVDREGIEELIEWLDKDTDFFTAPASAKYHNNFQGGLVNHSLNVYKNLMKFNTYNGLISDIDSITIVSLLHDVCKVGNYKISTRNTQDDNGNWYKVPFYDIDESFIYGHGSKSVLLIQRFIKLTDEEIMAIRYHMGAYEGFKDFAGIQQAFKTYPLAMFTHFADIVAGVKEDVVK